MTSWTIPQKKFLSESRVSLPVLALAFGGQYATASRKLKP
jgi:hypothetical protein